MPFEGLSGFRAEQEKKTVEESPYFKLTEKGQKAQIRPLVELDKTSINYSEKNGLPLFTQEFSNPQRFWLSIEDTRADEGSSLGWEMVAKYGWFVQDETKIDPTKKQHSDPKFNWNPQQFVYLPVLVKDKPDDEPRVEVMRVKYRGAEASTLIEYANSERNFDDDGNSEDPYKSITDRWWNYSRNNGTGFGVRYNLSPKDASADVDVTDFEVPDLSQFVNSIPYGADGSAQKEFLELHKNDDKREEASITADAPQASSSALTEAKW